MPPATLKFEYGYIYFTWGKSWNILIFDMLQRNKLTRKKKRGVTNVYLALRIAEFFTFLISLIKCLSFHHMQSSNTNSHWIVQIIYSNQNYINDNSCNINPVLYWIVKSNQFPPALYDFKYFRYILHKDIKITPVLLSESKQTGEYQHKKLYYIPQ